MLLPRFNSAPATCPVARSPFAPHLVWWLALVLVLVLGQGLTAPEARAQVRKSPPRPAPKKRQKPATPAQVSTVTVVACELRDGMTLAEPPSEERVYTYAEHMPSFRGGDLNQLATYLRRQVRRPPGVPASVGAGRVFVNFTVGRDGVLCDAQVVKGLHPRLDAEALRVVRALTRLVPGRQGGQAVAVNMTLPIAFEAK
jgi:TonB family protein